MKESLRLLDLFSVTSSDLCNHIKLSDFGFVDGIFGFENLFGKSCIEPIYEECFHLNSENEDRVMVGEEYTGISLIDNAIGKIKRILQKKFNPTPEDIEEQKAIDKITSSVKNQMECSALDNTQAEETEKVQDVSFTDKLNNVVQKIKDKIDGRKNNGKKPVDHICERISDETIKEWMQECYKRVFGIDIQSGHNLSMFLPCFISAFFKYVQKEIDRYEYYYQKIAHFYRITKSLLGELIGFGIRNLQYYVSWLTDNIEYAPSQNVWEQRKYDRHETWKTLEGQLYGMLCEMNTAVVDPD